MKSFSYLYLLLVGLNSFSQTKPFNFIENTLRSHDSISISGETKPNVGAISVGEKIGTDANTYPEKEGHSTSFFDALEIIHDPNSSIINNGSLYFLVQAPGNNFRDSDFVTGKDGGYSTYTISKDGSVESFTKAIYRTSNQEDSLTAFDRYIPLTKGFYTKHSASGEFVKIEMDSANSFRILKSDADFFRIEETGSSTESIAGLGDHLSRLRIHVDFNEEYTRDLLINFHPSFTEEWDYGLEAESPRDVESDAYWKQEENPMVIKALKLDPKMKIPLSFILNEQKNIRVRLANLVNFGHSQSVFINDSQTGKYYSIKNNGYTFDDLEPGVYEDRFFITFQDLTLSDREIFAKKIKIFVNQEKAVLTILNPELLAINEVRLFDLKGSAIINTKNLELNDKYEFNLGRLSDGVYVASLRLEQNQKVNQKLMVKKRR